MYTVSDCIKVDTSREEYSFLRKVKFDSPILKFCNIPITSAYYKVMTLKISYIISGKIELSKDNL